MAGSSTSRINVFRDAIDRGRATVWDVEEAYRSPACRVGGRGVFHDHAYCGEIAAPAVTRRRRRDALAVAVRGRAKWRATLAARETPL